MQGSKIICFLMSAAITSSGVASACPMQGMGNGGGAGGQFQQSSQNFNQRPPGPPSFSGGQQQSQTFLGQVEGQLSQSGQINQGHFHRRPPPQGFAFQNNTMTGQNMGNSFQANSNGFQVPPPPPRGSNQAGINQSIY